MNDARSQASKAMSQSTQGFEKQIAALKQQMQALDKPQKQDQKNENVLQQYINERANSDLMSFIDTYKRGILLEGTMKKFFKMFEKGKTNEEVLRHFAGKGVTIPETFLSKARKQYENVKKTKLEIEFSEQEAKDIVSVPTKGPEPILFTTDAEKQLSKRLYKN